MIVTRFNSKTEKKHPYHKIDNGGKKKGFAKTCRKCVLGDDYGVGK